MRFIDDKGRFFGKVSFIDLLVILAVVGLGVVLLQRGFINSQLGENVGEQKQIQITVFLPLLTQEQVDVLQEGSARLQKTGRNADVTIVGLDVRPAEQAVETREGEIVLTTHPSYFDAYVSVEGIGEVTSDKIVVGNLEVKIGTDIRLMTKYFEGLGLIYNIEE